jgi:hypothetical protein
MIGRRCVVAGANVISGIRQELEETIGQTFVDRVGDGCRSGGPGQIQLSGCWRNHSPPGP